MRYAVELFSRVFLSSLAFDGTHAPPVMTTGSGKRVVAPKREAPDR